MLKSELKQFKKLCRKAGQTIIEHKLIQAGDRILAGLSGGIDSLLLLEILSERKKSLPFDFEIFAVHVDVIDSGYIVNKKFLQNFCEELKIPYRTETIEAGIKKDTQKSECFLCSWHRRKKLFELTKELNCNKLCFGHHKDDALETFLINLFFHASISSLPYSLQMFDGRIQLIRPLLDIYKKDIIEYANFKNYPAPEKLCEYEDNTKRKFVREMLETFTKTYEKSKINLFNAMSNIYQEYLPINK